MNEIYKDIYQKRCQTTITALTDKGYTALYAENAQEACQKALEMIPLDAMVGAGGSNTVREMGLLTALESRGQKVLDHWKAGLNAEEKKQIRKSHLSCDVFLTSSNAVTMNGQLVNIDGTGNRVAAMIFGPGKIVIIAGVNKVVNTLEDALSRIKNVSAPLNGRRLGYKTPCALTGKCINCKVPDRMCNVTVIMDRKPRETEIAILLVGEELGY